jgi:hypothetical protein
MQNNANQAKLTLRKRIGSTVYVTKLYVKNDAAETMDDKILRIIRNEWNCSQKNGTIGLPQTGRLPERSSS